MGLQGSKGDLKSGGNILFVDFVLPAEPCVSNLREPSARSNILLQRDPNRLVDKLTELP